MTRNLFAGTSNDYVVRQVGSFDQRVPGAPLTFWSAETGGTQYTDLRNAANTAAITSVVSDAQGFIPAFLGPDGVASMWVDSGGPARRLLFTQGLQGPAGPAGSSGTDSGVAAFVTDSTSSTRKALNASFMGASKVATGTGIDPTGGTDSSAALQALLDAMPIEGGRLYIPAGIYLLNTGLVTRVPNLEICGAGARGQDLTVGSGATRLHYTGTGDAIVYNAPATATVFRGPVVRDIAISGTSSGACGLRLKRVNNFVVSNVAISDFSAGTALVTDGTGNVNQYGTLDNFQSSRCLNGIDIILNNGLRIIGGYLQGGPHPIAAGSFGIRMSGGGDTLRLFGMDVQGFDVLCDIQTGNGNELHGLRGEDWATAGLKVGSSRAAVLGASLNNTLNGSAGIAIWCTSGAVNPMLYPANIQACATAIQDDSGTATTLNGPALTMPTTGQVAIGAELVKRNSTGGIMLEATAGSHMAQADTGAAARVMNFRKAGAGAQDPSIALQSNSIDGPLIGTSNSFSKMFIDHSYASASAMSLRIAGTEILAITATDVNMTKPLKLTGQTTGTTAPAAGGAAALPATPAGYLTVTIGGVARQIPYY